MMGAAELGRADDWPVIEAGLAVRRHIASCAICRAYARGSRAVGAPCWIGRGLLDELARRRDRLSAV